MMLSLFLLSILMKMYLTVQRQYRLQTALETMQENADVALQVLQRVLHQSQQVILDKDKKTGSDKLIVTYVEFPGGELASDMLSDSVLYVVGERLFKTGEVLSIADHQQSENFTVKEMVIREHGVQEIATVKPLQHRYRQYAEVGLLQKHSYSLGKAESLLQDAEEVARGISGMHITKDAHGVTIRLDLHVPPFRKTREMYVAFRSKG